MSSDRPSPVSPASSLVELDPEQCERLLRTSAFGRVVLVADGRIEILPVNYTTVGDAAWMRTAPGSLLDRCADGVPLLLEIDHVDHERAHGWSVVARGQGERVPEGARSADERRAPGPPRWVRRTDDVWIQLRWEELSGRRTGHGWDVMAGLPVLRARG